MSLFNPGLDNNLEIRAQKIHGEQYLVMDPITQSWVPLTAGGSPVVLPSYLRENSIDIDDGTTGSELTASTLTFGDASGNASIGKPELKALKEVTERVYQSSPSNNDRLVIYDSAAKKYKVTLWRYYLRTSNISFSNASDLSYFAHDTLWFSDAQNRQLKLEKNKMTIQDSSTIYSTIDATKLQFQNDAVYDSFDALGVREVNKLLAKTLTAAPTTDDKILLWNANESAYKYADVPTGGGELPYYLKSNSLELDGPSRQTTITAGSIGLQNVDEEKGSELSSTTLTFGDLNGTSVLNKEDIAVTNKLKALTSATPGANSKMLIYDAGSEAFNYTDIPTGGGASKTPVSLFVSDNPIGPVLLELTEDGSGNINGIYEYSPTDQTRMQSYIMNDNEIVVLNVSGYHNTWYTIQLHNSGSPFYLASLQTTSTKSDYLRTAMTTQVYNRGSRTVPLGSFCFKIVSSDTSATTFTNAKIVIEKFPAISTGTLTPI